MGTYHLVLDMSYHIGTKLRLSMKGIPSLDMLNQPCTRHTNTIPTQYQYGVNTTIVNL